MKMNKYNKLDLVTKSISYRAVNKLTQKQFADLCKVSERTIQRFESGNKIMATTKCNIEMAISGK